MPTSPAEFAAVGVLQSGWDLLGERDHEVPVEGSRDAGEGVDPIAPTAAFFKAGDHELGGAHPLGQFGGLRCEGGLVRRYWGDERRVRSATRAVGMIERRYWTLTAQFGSDEWRSSTATRARKCSFGPKVEDGFLWRKSSSKRCLMFL